MNCYELYKSIQFGYQSDISNVDDDRNSAEI
jgi:hypothetical protein